MPSITKTLGAVVAGLAAFASAAPAAPKLTKGQMKIHEVLRRQNALAQAAGLTDIDILQFALTLELLEEDFYRTGFQQFPADQFIALGLTQEQVNELVNIGKTEEAHVIALQSAIAQAGTQPVQACTYNFGFTDAASMVATAAVLENVGVSAYAGAAKLLADPGILTTAATILTIEARHQAVIRVASKVNPVPQAFDTPLSAKMVFSLAAPFISSCPSGSNLVLTAFPTLTMAAGQSATAIQAGATIQLQSDAAAQAQFCGFTTGGLPGGTAFTAFTPGTGCQVPQGLAGITYVTLTSQGPLNGVISDDIILAGPMVMQAS
ncbi:protein rds1 [Echria macrotheca]|uniref:Protein rds1 n=1 Tax=Echria macrotheca TaxID=438768 RepID=A0AAJ0F9N7_9PEZI|nr:protein rds1 [Echria macrotheca]